MLSHIAEHVRKGALEIYNLISEARDEDVVWTAHGIDSYDLGDITEMITDNLTIGQLGIPSPTFHKERLTRIALTALRGASDTVKVAIQKEIAKGIPDEAEVKAEALAARVQAELDQNGIVKPGAKPPPQPGNSQAA